MFLPLNPELACDILSMQAVVEGSSQLGSREWDTEKSLATALHENKLSLCTRCGILLLIYYSLPPPD